MNFKYKSLLVFTFLILMILGCSQALYIPTLEDSQKTGVPADDLVLGRKLYVNNCGSCHRLYMPEQYTMKEWVKVMPEMKIKAKCNDRQVAMITAYLKARSKQN
jgi:mono/diheme cytochrome c family protein